MKKQLMFLASLAFVFVLAACGSTEGDENAKEATTWDQVQEDGEIVVGTSGTLVATSYYPEDSDQLSGYDVEVMRAVGEKLGVDVKFQEMGFDALFAAMNSGRIDAAINDIEVTEKREENYAFTTPYKYSYTTMVVREDGLSGIETLEDLEGKRAGGAATSVFSDIARHYDAEVVTYDNATNDIYLRDVDNGNTDVIINDYYLSKLGINAFPQFDLVLHPDIKVHPTKQAILLEQEDSELQKKMNEALEELREDGTLTELSKKFFLGEDASKQPEGEITEIEGLES
ncbi:MULTISPECIES: transporter substrate-binding domain-containing protein [Pontibacillus]|uniref:Transporter substrate-binding domain-containing protein n=1 Tax=Pontibacillus chungwhensis TaxID=265426 RepID=A0ABY8V0I4_9BACI|nr:MULTISPECIES: transporter substrate-binding domain-containing protein [Pontibacillus]MCD5324981.1 transporter substrate-binding domain-containing protein [Pontibacillus sp. HN14]WIF98938.1 transporter substrate-binding domain-containing protein [Pontibacillus chungwhensis]